MTRLWCRSLVISVAANFLSPARSFEAWAASRNKPIHFFNSSFLRTYRSSKDKCERWAGKVTSVGGDLLKLTKLIVPINDGSHWSLCVADVEQQVFYCFDPLCAGKTAPGASHADTLREYFLNEARKRHSGDVANNIERWRVLDGIGYPHFVFTKRHGSISGEDRVRHSEWACGLGTFVPSLASTSTSPASRQ